MCENCNQDQANPQTGPAAPETLNPAFAGALGPAPNEPPSRDEQAQAAAWLNSTAQGKARTRRHRYVDAVTHDPADMTAEETARTIAVLRETNRHHRISLDRAQAESYEISASLHRALSELFDEKASRARAKAAERAQRLYGEKAARVE